MSGNFVDGLGNLERTRKVREFENKWLCGRQSPENLFIPFKKGKDVLSHEIVRTHLPLHWRLLLKERGGYSFL